MGGVGAGWISGSKRGVMRGGEAGGAKTEGSVSGGASEAKEIAKKGGVKSGSTPSLGKGGKFEGGQQMNQAPVAARSRRSDAGQVSEPDRVPRRLG